jgi:hypothetical protein
MTARLSPSPRRPSTQCIRVRGGHSLPDGHCAPVRTTDATFMASPR